MNSSFKKFSQIFWLKNFIFYTLFYCFITTEVLAAENVQKKFKIASGKSFDESFVNKKSASQLEKQKTVKKDSSKTVINQKKSESKSTKKPIKDQQKKLKKDNNLVKTSVKKLPILAKTQEQKIQQQEQQECLPQEQQQVSDVVLDKKLQEAQFYFLFDPQTSQVLLSKNADVRAAPSSMTKIMTAYVVFDQIKKGLIALDKQCFISKNAWKKSGSTMFLNYGDMVSIDELLKGLLAVSGNDAAIALAEAVSGSVENFVDLMNLKARELKLNNSHFANPHGLSQPMHYMSVRDLANLTARFYKDFPQYAKYLGIESFTYANITQINRNPLIKKHYDGVLGGKTGHTDDGGYGVVGAVKRDNTMLIAVVNKARTPRQRAETITKLFDYGFGNYKKYQIFAANSELASLKTWLGKSDFVSVINDQEVAFNLPKDADLNKLSAQIEYQGPIYAPIKKGDKVATLIIKMNNQKIIQYPLFAKETVEKVGYIGKINQILRYKMRSFFNKIL